MCFVSLYISNINGTLISIQLLDGEGEFRYTILLHSIPAKNKTYITFKKDTLHVAIGVAIYRACDMIELLLQQFVAGLPSAISKAVNREHWSL